ncbi:MAG: dienelactone hydrolase family protein [Parasulfuritortus sp.]|jgi:dienelactone hydrolase|nr:dienelactone hydrolase family protein [Parasulfuritortus sp.]
MRKFILILATVVLGATSAQAKVVGKEVRYTDNGVTLKGYMAYDNSIKAKRPGILVVHEWWGLNDYARKRARMLAGMGYTALAVDMYGNGKTANHPNDAGKFAAEVNKNMPMEKSRFEAAMKVLEADKTVDQDQIAAIGYCFGGGVVLNMARLGENLKAVASFHGALPTDTPAQPGMVKARVAVFTGADDPMAPPKVVEAFETEMKNAGVDYHLTSYPGAKHSFTNPDADKLGKEFNLPLAYNAAADKDSWKQLGELLTSVFGQQK